MILSRTLLGTICSELRAAGKSIVFSNGCFDIIHAGHVSYLDDARKLGDCLVLGLNSDDSVRRLKGSERPVNNQKDRALVIDALRAVDYVCVFAEDTPYELIKTVQPDVLVKGGDWSPAQIVGADIVRKRGGQVLSIPFVQGKSTTAIIEKIHRQPET